jgi:hypothetical protein
LIRRKTDVAGGSVVLFCGFFTKNVRLEYVFSEKDGLFHLAEDARPPFTEDRVTRIIYTTYAVDIQIKHLPG